MGVLDVMDASLRWDVAAGDPLQLAGKLKSSSFETQYEPVPVTDAHAACASRVSIGFAAYTLKTEKGTREHGCTKRDDWAYVPFVRSNREVPCVLHIKQLLHVSSDVMGWEGSAAKIASGVLYEGKAVTGPGFVTQYNEDTTFGAIQFPTMIRFDPRQGYKWAIHISQIACPVVMSRLTSSVAECVTICKTGFHG